MRGAHQAFFLDDDEKTRAVELLRRVNALYREKSMREAMGALQGRRHSQQHPFQSLLPFPVAREGHYCSRFGRD